MDPNPLQQSLRHASQILAGLPYILALVAGAVIVVLSLNRRSL